ncbi:MAG: hypothetical protein QG610_2382 [Euryarchaeota archaeon]|nr:hypothetical protein [Euryarchaeota archaeon]
MCGRNENPEKHDPSSTLHGIFNRKLHSFQIPQLHMDIYCLDSIMGIFL